MRPTFKRSAFAAGLALTLPFGLAACGGGAPSKDEVQAGLKELMAPELSAIGASDEALDEYFSCMVDEFYDDVEDATLKNIADAKDEAVASDTSTLTNAATDCMDLLM